VYLKIKILVEIKMNIKSEITPQYRHPSTPRLHAPYSRLQYLGAIKCSITHFNQLHILSNGIFPCSPPESSATISTHNQQEKNTALKISTL
jgi:hypothetical protein